MAIVERHVSPDRSLTLVVDLSGGDWTIGFEGFAWHTHGDILIAYGRHEAPEVATRLFVEDVINSVRPLVVYRTNGAMHDVIVPDDFVDRPLGKNFAKYSSPGETMEVRRWDGAAVAE